jgi:hypothetical protein
MRLAGFVVLLAAAFLAARVVSAQFGPVTTSHSHVVYTGGGGSVMYTGGGAEMSGMNMGTSP